MRADYLSSQQRAALEPDARLIEAGPGSGKTRAVVARYRQVASQPGQFAALVSFTNSAVEEVRIRCSKEPHYLQSPNFVGTFDAFFHRFVTTPSFLRGGGKQPQYLASWDDLPEHWSRLRPATGGTGVPLTAFKAAANGSFHLNETRLARLDRITWGNLSPYSRKLLSDQAMSRHASLASAGIMSAETARSYALRVLEGVDGSRILELLRRRFSELIVDEFQDCNETEIHLLNLLRSKGLAVVAVADPDQAIYRFRQSGVVDLYQEFRKSVAPSEIALLNECHRSTAAICSVVSSLRSVSTNAVCASDLAPEGPAHVYVLEGKKGDILAKANAVLTTHGISPLDSRILSHGTNDARSLIHGRAGAKGASSARRILDAILQLRRRGPVKDRSSALSVLGHVFVSAVSRPEPIKATSMAETLTSMGIETASLHMLSKRLVDASHQWNTPDDYATSLASVIVEGFREFGLTPKLRLKSVFPKPKPELWTYWLAQIDGLDTAGSLGWRSSNIHQVKGGEFDAVLLCIPSRSRADTHSLDDWESNSNSEQRRVLYVGASRAQRLLMIWAEGQRTAQLLRILKRDQIRYIVV